MKLHYSPNCLGSLLLIVLIIFIPVVGLHAQLTGVVTDAESGTGLIGVTIMKTGTTTGTTTDIDGSYSITAAPGEQLTFSYTGYTTQTVEVGSAPELNVALASDVQDLDEIVVVGYGTRKKSDLTGSLVSISSEDFEAQPLTRVDEALQGRSAGVQVTQTSGAPGAGYKIRIRGANSISGSNDPLYVVDGLIVGSIDALNVNDIKSLEVLKDAAATAIYGSRGANGVVLVTTKSGQAGEAKVELNAFWGRSNVIQKISMLSAADFARGVNFEENSEFFSPEEIERLEREGGEDWQDRLFRTAPFANYQLSFSGGSEKTQYFVSANYYDAEGTIINQQYKRYTFRTNVNANLSDRLSLGVNIFGSREVEEGVRADLSTGLTWDPTTPAFDAQGNYNFTPLIPGVGNALINPLVVPENNVRDNFGNQVIANANANYDFLNGLTLNVSGGLDRIDRNNNSYVPILVDNQGQAVVLNRTINRYQNTNRLTFQRELSPVHQLQVDAIHEQQLLTNVFSDADVTGFFSDNTTYNNLALGAIQRSNNGRFSESIQSFLGRANYNFAEQLLVTVAVRTDGASKFRAANRWGVFPSASVAYRLSETGLIPAGSAVGNLKVRLSYGLTGSQGIEALATRARPIVSPDINYPFGGGTNTIGVAPSRRLANPDLTWEKTAQYNLGVDLGLWNGKVTASVDVYRKNTTDLLLDVQLPEFVGPTVVARNIGEVRNTGVDVNLGFNPVRTADLSISTILNLSHYRNEVIALVNDEPIEMGGALGVAGIPVNPTRVEVGQPISAFRGYVFEGVYQLEDADEAARFGLQPGDARYRDINGDGVINPDDITTVGDGNPDITWGLNTNIDYKRFNLNFLLLGTHGNEIYNLQRGRMMALGATQFHATHGDYANRWTPDNPSDIPARRTNTQFLSSQFIEDGSFVTLKNVSLAYTFTPGGGFAGLDDVRLFINAGNLFILTGYSGFDPESTASGNSDVNLGIDYNAYPLARSFSAGFNLTF